MTNDKDFVLEEKKTAPVAKKGRGIAAVSLLVSLFDKLGALIYIYIITGFFGRIFTSYSSLQDKFQSGAWGRLFYGNHFIRRFCRRVRRFLASIIDSCFFMSDWKKTTNYLCSLPLNHYGNFMFFFGIYTVVVYFVKFFIPGLGEADPNYVIIGSALFLTAIPLLFARRSLAMSVKRSVILRTVFQGALGFSDYTFDKPIKTKGKGALMLFLGLVAGTLTFFIHPLLMIVSFLILIVLFLVAVSPEIGVLITISSVPFLSFFDSPTIVLCVMVWITSFLYLIKLIRGKRVFKADLLDLFVLAFVLFVFLSSLFSAGGQASLFSAIVCITLMMGYFLVVNLLRTEKWVKRCVYALISSAAVVAFIGIVENFVGADNNNWLDLSLFSGIRIRVVSLFENPNVLSVFLTLVFPFIIAAFCVSKAKNEKILSVLVGITVLACIVFTWSRGAWLAVVIGTLLFFIIYNNKKAFRAIGLFLLALPVVPILIPENVVNRFLSMFNLSDSSISYRIYTWRGTLAAIKDYWFSGVGFGNEAFQKIYPGYAYSGIEAAEHSHSLFLQIMMSMGVFALVLFGIIVFLVLQKSFEYIKAPQSRASGMYVIATIVALCSAMIMGVFDYIWYNYRVFYIFWIVIALGCAFIRVGNYEVARKQDITPETN